MKGDLLPDEHHVARYCKPKTIDENGRPNPEAFQRRPGEEYPSVSWLEFFSEPSQSARMQHVRKAFEKKGYRTAASGQFAVLSVADMNGIDECDLSVEHRPCPDDPSHSGIFGYPPDDDLDVARELAQLVKELFPTREIDDSSD